LADSPSPRKPSGPTEPQLKRLFAISQANGWAPGDAQKLMLKKFGTATSATLTKFQYEELCDFLQKNKPDDGNIK
jgi:hypothetical protein